jgi:hypothetical protein
MRSKRTVVSILAVLLIAFVVPAAVAQDGTVGLDKYGQGFSDFAGEIANSLPLNASIGLNTPSAYIGQLLEAPPSVGVGLTTGASTLPLSTVENTFDTLNIPVPSALDKVQGAGFPLPSAAIDARVGGFLLPFDAGVKFGTLPDAADTFLPEDMTADYILAGADVRLALIEQGVALPNLSVGAGYNYLRTSLTMADVFDTGFNVTLPTSVNGISELQLDKPDAKFQWRTNSIDLKAQVSKKLLIFTPYAGAAASFSRSAAGGSLVSQLQDGGGSKISSSDLDEIKKQLDKAGYSLGDVSAEEGITIEEKVTGWSFRVFGGTSLNLLVFRLDLGVGYDLLGNGFRGTVGARVQL